MKHLFIINPIARNIKGSVSDFVSMVHRFFENYSHLEYDIHVTRWSRDAVGFTRRYASGEKQLVRIYAVGGTGTIFEVINGVIGLPNVQIANYPVGLNNSFVRYFGEDKKHLFLSLRNLVFSETVPIDLIRCGTRYAYGFSTIGTEAYAYRGGEEMFRHTRIPVGLCYGMSGAYHIFKDDQFHQQYHVKIAGENIRKSYASIMVANAPCYGNRFRPAVDAHPGDGHFDVYLINKVSPYRLMRVLSPYLAGNYAKFPDIITHYAEKKMNITSDHIMCINVDGEVFYDTTIDYEIMPYAVDFVCPAGIEVQTV